MERVETLSNICANYIGRRYDDPEVATGLHSDGVDWSQCYPEVDGEGLITGDVLMDTDGEWAIVADVAAVAFDNLPHSMRIQIEQDIEDGTWDGYVKL